MVPAPGVMFSILSFVHRVFTPTQFRCGRPRRSGSLRALPQLAWGSMRIDVSKMALQPFVQKRPAVCNVYAVSDIVSTLPGPGPDHSTPELSRRGRSMGKEEISRKGEFIWLVRKKRTGTNDLGKASFAFHEKFLPHRCGLQLTNAQLHLQEGADHK